MIYSRLHNIPKKKKKTCLWGKWLQWPSFKSNIGFSRQHLTTLTLATPSNPTADPHEKRTILNWTWNKSSPTCIPKQAIHHFWSLSRRFISFVFFIGDVAFLCLAYVHRDRRWRRRMFGRVVGVLRLRLGRMFGLGRGWDDWRDDGALGLDGGITFSAEKVEMASDHKSVKPASHHITFKFTEEKKKKRPLTLHRRWATVLLRGGSPHE